MKNLKYFSTAKLTKGFSIALLLSLFIYLHGYGVPSPTLETLAGTVGLYLLLSSEAQVGFHTGLFIAVLWFGWITSSFSHYGFSEPLSYLAMSGVALVYGLLLYIPSRIVDFAQKRLHFPVAPFGKALYLYFVGYIHPFGFDWFDPRLIFVDSWFGVDGIRFAIILLSLSLSISARTPAVSIAWLILLAGAIDTDRAHIVREDPEKRIYLVTTSVPVEKKWSDGYARSVAQDVYEEIEKRIAEGYEAIVFPESVIPFFLNDSPETVERLSKYSREIDIVIGALYDDGGVNKNSAYHFYDGRYEVAHKVVLVPFGESNPLPDWASRIVNRIFFDGAPDYIPASETTDFTIASDSYRCAICYEGTSDRLYRDSPSRMILISNNGWFVPSIEPVLQSLLLKYRARIHGTRIYHSVNMSPSYIVVPPKDGKKGR